MGKQKKRMQLQQLIRQSLNWRITLFYLLPPLLAVAAVMTVTIKTDLSAFIIAGDNAEEILLAGEMQSGALSRRYLISISSNEEGSVPNAFTKTIQNRFKSIGGVVDVWSPKQQTDTARTMQELYSSYAGSLYSLSPEVDLAKTFSPQGLKQKAAFLKKALLSPQAPLVKQIAVKDPLLLTLDGFQLPAAAGRQSADNDHRYQNLILETAVAGLDVSEQKRIQQAINKEFNSLNQTWQDLYQLEMTGVPVFAVATQTLIQGDITKVSIISSIALMFLFLLIFRSFGALFQVFTLLAVVIMTAILTTHFTFGYIHGMTIAIGSTLVGICIDYPIHAVVHAQTVPEQQRTSVVAKIWPSMLLGGLTTLVGYAALGISGYPGFRQIAVYAAAGIVTALLLTRFVLPGLIKTQGHRQLDLPLVKRWTLFCQRYRIWLITVLLCALLASIFGLKSLQWLEDMQKLTPELNYLKDNDKRIRSRMVSIEPGRFVMVTAENTEAALQKTEEVYQVLERLKKQGELSGYFGLYPWLLSGKQQQRNQQLLKEYLTADNLSLWQRALQQQGLSVKRLGHFDYPLESQLTIEQVFNTPVKRLIDSRIIEAENQSIIMIWIADHQPAALKKALEKIDGAQYFSQRDMLNNMLVDYTNKAKILLLSGLALIILLLVARYKSLQKAIQTLLPAVLAAFFILGAWAVTGAAVSFLHLVGFLLAVAICVDYGIFYKENRGGNIALTYQAMAASMLTSALAFGSLIVADSASLRILAGVVALGVVLGFLFCPIIIRHTLKSNG